MGAKYAQHFLTNRHAAERIVESVRLTPSDDIFEIGPGKGSLTAYMLKARTLAIVEVDPEMITLLQARFGLMPNVHLFHSDVLEFDFKRLYEISGASAPFKVVGNLPYNLTSPILRRLSEWNGWKEAFIMVQKEVAERLCAKHSTPEYGALTVGMSLTCKAEFIFELSQGSFTPPPKVKSAVVKLLRRDTPLTTDVDSAQKVIQAAFQQRRKTIINSLSHGLNLEKTVVQPLLEKLNVDPGTRPERLPVDVFVKISEALFRNERPEK